MFFKQDILFFQKHCFFFEKQHVMFKVDYKQCLFLQKKHHKKTPVFMVEKAKKKRFYWKIVNVSIRKKYGSAKSLFLLEMSPLPPLATDLNSFQ